MIIPVKILDSDFLDVTGGLTTIEFLLNTDHVLLATEGEGGTILIMGASKAPYIVIDMDYQTYKALVSAGFESAHTAAVICAD